VEALIADVPKVSDRPPVTGWHDIASTWSAESYSVGSTIIPAFAFVEEVKISVNDTTFTRGSPVCIGDVFPRAMDLNVDLVTVTNVPSLCFEPIFGICLVGA